MAFDAEEQLDELKELMGSGVVEEQHGDKKTKFATGEDLMFRINYVTREKNGTSNRRPNGGVIVFKR